jgi:hypothetical protein
VVNNFHSGFSATVDVARFLFNYTMDHSILADRVFIANLASHKKMHIVSVHRNAPTGQQKGEI